MGKTKKYGVYVERKASFEVQNGVLDLADSETLQEILDARYPERKAQVLYKFPGNVQVIFWGRPLGMDTMKFLVDEAVYVGYLE